MAATAPAGSREPRAIRVFISSTFRDMQADRETLSKHVFPLLRKLCEERGVTFTDVDLRWGITGEQKAEGKVLPICLEEINRCRPYFIGLLGERYGWIPESFPPEVIACEPWLREHVQDGKSVTELEVIHGVLRNPDMNGRAFFYFRDPAYIASLSPETRGDFLSENPESREKLERLKGRIRRSGYPVQDYPDPAHLAECVEADLCALINRVFPEDSNYDPVAEAHLQFAASRRRFWIGREAESQRLNSLVATAPATMVISRTGSGQSAFLANWAAAWRQMHPDTLVVEHYVGAHPDATSLDGCSRQLCMALAEARGLAKPTAAAEHDWPDIFVEYLALAGRAGPTLLVIDGADRLRGRGEAAGAEWLLGELPDGVQVVAGAGESAMALAEHRKWPILSLGELSLDDCKTFVCRYLEQYGKTLSPADTELIASRPANAKPFYLEILLEELRQHGDNDTLKDRLAELAALPDVAHLCRAVFARCERDYDGAFPGLTAKALSLLATAQLGLSDTELCELLGAGGEPLPQRPLSELELALGRILVSRSGLTGFAHPYAQQAARERYIPPGRERELHRRLADFFLARPISPRAATETLFHLRKMEEWAELGEWLGCQETFAVLWSVMPAEVCATWAEIEARSPCRAAQFSSRCPQDLRPALLSLLRQLGHWRDALDLVRKTNSDDAKTPRSAEELIAIGEIEIEGSMIDEAVETFRRAEKRATATNDTHAILRALRGQAQAIMRTLPVLPGHALIRAQRERKLAAVRSRVADASRTMTDELSRNEAMLASLEEYAGAHVSTQQVQAERQALYALTHIRSSKLLRLGEVLKEKAAQAKTIGKRLRFTRYRELALRSDVARAQITNNQAGLAQALEFLRQHAAARDDNELLAAIYAVLAEIDDNQQKLHWLAVQAQLFERTGQQRKLAWNRVAQALLLGFVFGRGPEARSLIRRVAQEKLDRGVGVRLLLLVLPLALTLRPYARLLPTVVRASIVVVGPLWLWEVWRFAHWVGTWFTSQPLLGLLAYLMAFFCALLPVGLMLSMLFYGLEVIRKRRQAGRKDKSISVPTQNGATTRSRVANQRRPSPEGKLSASVTPRQGAQRTKAELPAFLQKLPRFNLRMARRQIRVNRIGLELKLNSLGWLLVWCAIALPPGVVLSAWFWHMSGRSRIWVLTVGVIGQILALDAFAVLLSATSLKIFNRMPRYVSTQGGSLLRFTVMIRLLRLKRLILGKRRPRVEHLGSHN